MKIIKKYIKRSNKNWDFGNGTWVVVAKLENNEYITWSSRTYQLARVAYFEFSEYIGNDYCPRASLKAAGLI